MPDRDDPPRDRSRSGFVRLFSGPSRDEHYDVMPLRHRLLLISAIFFTFGTLGPLLGLMRSGPRDPWWGTALWVLFCGAISVGWAMSFMRRLWLMPIVIAAQFFVPPMLGQMIGNPWRFGLDGMILGGWAITSLAAGYVLTTMFINAEGRLRLSLEGEMSAAQRIHTTLVPPLDTRLPGLHVYGRSTASSRMGGDLLDIVEENGRCGVYLADVSGHGVGAGVVMAMVKASIRMRLRSDAPLDSLLNDLNAVVAGVTSPEMFVTFACVRFDPGPGPRRAQVGLAGHLPIFHVAAGERVVRDLPNDRLPLGVTDDETYVVQSQSCAPGDLFALYTDGLTETMDREGRQFGVARLRALIADLADRPLDEIHADVLRAVEAHGGQSDDRTLLLVRVTA